MSIAEGNETNEDDDIIVKQERIRAKSLVAEMRVREEGVETMSDETMMMITECADAGDAVAMNVCAECLWSGGAMGKDKKKAIKLWERATELGHTEAMHNLGVLHQWCRSITRQEESY